MKYGMLLGRKTILGIELEIYSNEKNITISNEFYTNNSGVKLGMNHQCVQLGRKFYYEYTGIDSYSLCIDLHASCWFRWRKKLGLDEIMYSNVMQGDFIIFHGGQYGHFAIISEVEENGFWLIQQNFFNDSRDIDFYISFDDVLMNKSFFSSNGDEYKIEDFLRINKDFDKNTK